MNLEPDCNLKSNSANGECGATSGAGFGIPTPILGYSDQAKSRVGQPPLQLDDVGPLEHELAPGIAASVGYYRNTYGNIVSHRQPAGGARGLQRVLRDAAG